MRKWLLFLTILGLLAAEVYSQQQGTVPHALAYDRRIIILEEFLRQDSIETVSSFRSEPNRYYAEVYQATPPLYCPLCPAGNTMQAPSVIEAAEHIFLGPYMIVIYDFEHDGIIDAGEWKDINGDFMAQPIEWFDENGDGIREAGEWTDVNNNGLVDLNELSDANGNGVFDIGEWHEGKNTDANAANNLPGEFNGAVDPGEWLGMNLDRSITKKLAIKIYKRITDYYKEIDYKEYISPTSPAKVFQHPALRAMTALTDNQKLVVLLSLDECERCDIVGGVAWYEDEYAQLVFNFKGFSRETLYTTLARCEGCFEAQVTHYVGLQIAMHEKFTLLYDTFFLHTLQSRGLPDNREGTTAYYYTAKDEMAKEIRQVVSFDPYYMVIRDNNELVLYETDYGKALIVPYEDKEREYSSHIYKRKYPDGTEKDIRVEVIHVYEIETPSCEQVIVTRLLVDEDTQAYNTNGIDPDEKVYTVFYHACNNTFENNIIFPEEYERGLTDFAIIVEKVELENEKVWLKFVREVDSQTIPSPAAFPYAVRDYQIVFDNLDRSKPLGTCDYYPKEERYVPQFKKILVDVTLPIRDLLNNVVLKYEDLKGDPNELSSYEEQPWEMAEWNTEVTQVQIRKVAYNPSARDYTGLGYEGNPPFTLYVPPLDPAPGLVQVGPNLLPNFQISDQTFSGTCVPGDRIIFFIEVFNGSGGPMSVVIQDDIPNGMFNAAVPHVPPPAIAAPAGVIVDTNGDFILGNGGDTVVWNIPALPPGYTLLTYQANVLADGSVGFGSTIFNADATIYYYDMGIQRTLAAPPVTILVEAAQLVKEPFQDLACTIPAPTIGPGNRLYYRLTAYNTISPASPIPYTALVTDISDEIPPITINPQYEVSPPLLVPQPIVANTVLWQGAAPVAPGNSISVIYSVLVPVGSAGMIVNDADLTYDVTFPPPITTTVDTTSNITQTWIQTALTQMTEPLEPCLTMLVTKEGPDVQAAGVVHYRILVANLGVGPYADAYNLVIIDRIPENMGAPFNIVCTNPLVTWNLYDSNGDGTQDLIVWKLRQLAAGDAFYLDFDVNMLTIPYNCYALKVYTYDLYRQQEDRYLGMGGIARVGDYKITPEDMVEVIKDAVFTQVMKGSEKLENHLWKIFESRIYNKQLYFEFADFNEKDRSARFKMYTRVRPSLETNVYWGVLEEVTMDTGSSQIYSTDTFLAYVIVSNSGDGKASEISYELDAPDFAPVDMTWIYDVENHLNLEISPEEQAGLLFLMKAPSVSRETTFPIKVRVTYSDGVETKTDTKTVYLNVLSQRRANVDVKKTVIEGKSVVKETGKEVVDMRVGEERTITAYIRNVSEEEIKQLHYVDQIPQGLEVVEGKSEWMGSVKPGETVKVTYKVKVKQIGIYQFKGKTFYKDEQGHVYEGVSNTTEIRVITEPGPKLRRELDSTTVKRGDTLTVVIRVENDTPNLLKNMQIVDIIPEGFQVESLETKGLQEGEGTIRYYIDELKPNKYILLKYVLRAGEKAGRFTYKGVRLAYENGSGLKEEIMTGDENVLIPETETPNLQLSYQLIRKVDADGEYITTVMDLLNNGGISATKIKLQAALLPGTQFLEASTDYLREGDFLIFSIDEIEPGDQFTVKYTFKVPHSNQDISYNFPFSVVYSDDFEREYLAEAAGNFVVRSQAPIVGVTKVVDRDGVKLNFSVRVAVTVANDGDIPAVAHVVDPLPEGMVLLSGTNDWEGILEPGESAQILYEMLCTRVGTFSLPSTNVTYEDKWKTIYTAESQLIPLTVRGILVEKSADVTTLKVGEVVVVTVRVTNTYDEKATNIIIRDTENIPEGFSLVEGDTSWTIAALNPGEQVTFTYSLKPAAAGSFNLGAATATFIDVYNDKHESQSVSVSVTVEEVALPPEETKAPPEEEAKEAVETITKRLLESFDITLILVIFLIMAISMMLAFLLIERRRTEEEEHYEVGIPAAPPEGVTIFRKEEAGKPPPGKPPLPTVRERAEKLEEVTPLDVVRKRMEKIEEKKEEVEKVAKSRDIRELLEKKEEGEVEFEEKFEFGEEVVPKKMKEEEIGLEDLFEKEKSKEPEKSEFTDVRDILKIARKEEETKKNNRAEPPNWGDSTNEELPEVPDLRELIKGTRKFEEEEEKSKSEGGEEEEDSDRFNARDVLKKKD